MSVDVVDALNAHLDGPGAIPLNGMGASWDGCRCGKRHDLAESALFPSVVASRADSDEAVSVWEAPEPAWVREAFNDALQKDLAVATTAPVGRGALALLSLLDPVGLAATACGSSPDGLSVGARNAATAMLLDGVVVAQRLINHVHAIQQQLMAAFCCPGVAIPLSDLMDLAGNDLSGALAAAIDTNGSTSGVNTDSGPSHRTLGLLRESVVKAASAEIGCALRLSPVTARLRCETALDLVDHLPATVAAQQTGDLDPYRARLISDKLAVLPEALRGRVERRVVPNAASRTVAGFIRILDREILAVDPAAAQRRVSTPKSAAPSTPRAPRTTPGSSPPSSPPPMPNSPPPFSTPSPHP